MDTSQQYILMCEKATEVQKLYSYKPDWKGDNFFVRKYETTRCEILTKELYERELPEEYKRFCVFSELERKLKRRELQTILADNGEFIKWSTGKFEYGELTRSSNICWAEELGSDTFIWIPTTEQLCDIIGIRNCENSTHFINYLQHNSKNISILTRGFDSLEKHLLVFYMSLRVRKVWVENDFI